MRRGCISMGNVKCDSCQQTIPYPERYLTLEQGQGKNQAVCLHCCEEKGLMKSESEKVGEELSFDLAAD